MKHPLWRFPVVVILLSSAVPLSQVWLDRQGTPRGSLTFSDRELDRWYGRDENTGEVLSWTWVNAPELDSVPYDELAGLGISCQRTGYECDGRSRRRGWMVLEIATAPWQAKLDSLQARFAALPTAVADSDSALARETYTGLEENIHQQRFHTSRLRMVAVGTDADPLVAKWNDGRHLIIAARIRAFRTRWVPDSTADTLRFYRVVAEALPGTLYVPAHWIPMVRDTGIVDARYDVTVTVGRGWLPRITDVRPASDTEPDTYHRP